MLPHGDESDHRPTSAYVRSVPDHTLETLARSIHKEGLSYGLSPLDFVRFVNLLLDRVITADTTPSTQRIETPGAKGHAASKLPPRRLDGLPCSEGRVILRQLDVPSDQQVFEHWLSDPHGRNFFLPRLPTGSETCGEFLARNAEHIAIVMRTDKTPIGAVAFLHHDPIHRRAELRKIIGDPAARRQGYAREATRLWIRFGFEVLGLRKIYLDTLDTNLRNIRLNESLGFVVEGILRNEFVLDGQECDVLRMGLCLPSNRSDPPPTAGGPKNVRR
jgi:RimJ/RimL family protein N-acetyltransferase